MIWPTLEQEELGWESLQPPGMAAATKRPITRTKRRSDKRTSRGSKKCAPKDAVGEGGLVFSWEGIEELAHANNLCATGPSLQAALRSSGCGSDAGRCEQGGVGTQGFVLK